mmetsp:Transcript_91946/g.263329  ORF Transcript_91946/g.263329 Transcript_91946/m.263329 type:complete len:103 (-) Transcript_91946:558-866(-)
MRAVTCAVVLKDTGNIDEPRATITEERYKSTATNICNATKVQDRLATPSTCSSGNIGSFTKSITTPVKKIAIIAWYSASTSFSFRDATNWKAWRHPVVKAST